METYLIQLAPIVVDKLLHFFLLGLTTYVGTYLNWCTNIIYFRTATARGKAEQSDIAAVHAREDAQYAVNCAKDYGAAEDSTTTGLMDDLALPSLEANNVASSVMASKHVAANNSLSVKTNTATAANNSKWILNTLV